MDLTLKAFETWLGKQRDGSIVGIARRSKNCPVAEYTKEATNNSHVNANSIYVTVLSGEPGKKTWTKTSVPTWMQRFIRIIDAEGSVSILMKREHPIRKERAIYLLGLVKEQLPKVRAEEKEKERELVLA